MSSKISVPEIAPVGRLISPSPVPSVARVIDVVPTADEPREIAPASERESRSFPSVSSIVKLPEAAEKALTPSLTIKFWPILIALVMLVCETSTASVMPSLTPDAVMINPSVKEFAVASALSKERSESVATAVPDVLLLLTNEKAVVVSAASSEEFKKSSLKALKVWLALASSSAS